MFPPSLLDGHPSTLSCPFEFESGSFVLGKCKSLSISRDDDMSSFGRRSNSIMTRNMRTFDSLLTSDKELSRSCVCMSLICAEVASSFWAMPTQLAQDLHNSPRHRDVMPAFHHLTIHTYHLICTGRGMEPKHHSFAPTSWIEKRITYVAGAFDR